MKAKVDKIKAHGINVFINRQLIYNYPEQVRRARQQRRPRGASRLLTWLRPTRPRCLLRACAQLFADAGIVSIEHADFDGIDRLSSVLGTRSPPAARRPPSGLRRGCGLTL